MDTTSVSIRDFSEELANRASTSVGHSPSDWQSLATVSKETIPWAEEMGRTYAAALYDSQEALSDESQAFSVWYERIASGSPGESFWSETCLDGFVYAAADIDNGRVFAALGKVSQLFLQKTFTAFPQEQALATYAAFRRVLDVAGAVLADSYVSALLRGMSQIGLNERLLKRMRTVAIRKMVDEGRSSIPMMTWDNALSVGVQSIDDQHKRLIAQLNELHQAKAAGKGDETLKRVLRELLEYTKYHFDFEENLLQTHGYPGIADHAQAHVALKAQVINFVEAFESGKAAMNVELFLFLRNWLNGHIRGTDRRYTPFFADRGVN